MSGKKADSGLIKELKFAWRAVWSNISPARGTFPVAVGFDSRKSFGER